MNLEEESYQKLKKQCQQVPADQLRKPQGTVSQVVKDGLDQIAVAKENLTDLVDAGMDPKDLALAETAINAYNWVDGLYATSLCSDSADKTLREVLVKDGYALCSELVHFGTFGIKKNGRTDLQEQFSEITKGVGEDNLIRELKDLHLFFTSNPTVTAGLKQFTTGWVEEALQKHIELTDLRTRLRASANETNLDQFKAEKRGAFTIYQNAIDDVREWGQFVFKGTERAEKYKAGFLTARNKRKKKTGDGTIENEDDAIA